MSTSTLGFALLALLAKGPRTAYELAQRAKRPLGYFWSARYGQIHPQLRELTGAGLLEEEAAPGPGPHDKRIYHITDAGLAALAGWVCRPPRAEPTRDELLVKAYAVWTAEPVAARDLLLAQAELHRARLAEYEETLERVVGAHPHGRVPPRDPDFGSLVTLRYGIGYQRNRLDWCEWLAAQLDT